MGLPLVSIVTPSYNQAHFLEATIRSVINQNYPHLEYIIVDGGSTDESVEIIHRYAPYLAWWVSEKDEGQAQAINKGFSHAKGEILAWINSDDLYLPDAIQNAVTALEQNPQLGLVYGDAVTIDEQGCPLHLLAFGDWKAEDLLAFRIICQPAVFFRRSVWEAAGGLNESLHYMLDHDLWQRMAQLCIIGHVRQIWAAARHHLQAKNVQQAEHFADEIERTMQGVLKTYSMSLTKDQVKQIKGGAYRLQGRYYLDGGKPLAALKAYGRSFWHLPKYTLEHKHRILYALLELMGIAGAAEKQRVLREKERRYRAAREVYLQIQKNRYAEWDGLCLPVSLDEMNQMYDD